MLIQSDCYGVYRMNGLYRGYLIGVYDVIDPMDALDACIKELGLAEDTWDYTHKEMKKDERYSDNMTEDEYNKLFDETFDDVCDRFWISHMTFE